MKKTLKLITSLLLIISLLILAGCNNSSSVQNAEKNNETIKLNLSHVLSEASHFHVTAKKFAEIANEKSDGKIKIDIFPSGQLGQEIQSIQAARDGGQDLLITGSPALTNTISEYSLFDLPYLFNSIDEANKVLSGEVGKEFLDKLPEYDLVGLGFLSVLERNVFSQKPIHNASDFSKFKIRVVQAPLYVKAYEALESQPTPMPYSEVYLGMQQGAIDGGETSPDLMLQDKFAEVSKYYNLTKSQYYPVLLIMSKKSWEKLSEEHQNILKAAAEEAIKDGTDYYKQSYTESLNKLKEDGIEIIETDTDSLKVKTQTVVDTFKKENPDMEKYFELIQKAK